MNASPRVAVTARLGVAALVLVTGCASSAPREHASHPPHAPHGAHGRDAPPGADGAHAGRPHHASQDTEDALAAVARIHGGAGPWAVAGWRMGSHALRELGLAPGSFDLEVVHHTPREVQHACIADGAAAATGASVGKLNLTLAEATADATRTTYRRRSTGRTITLRVAPAFAARFADVPRERLADAGRQVLALPDAEVFVVDAAEPLPR